MREKAEVNTLRERRKELCDKFAAVASLNALSRSSMKKRDLFTFKSCLAIEFKKLTK